MNLAQKNFTLDEIKCIRKDEKNITINEMIAIFEKSGFENWLSINHFSYYSKVYLQAKENKTYGVYKPIAMFFDNISKFIKPVKKCSCKGNDCQNINCYKGKLYDLIFI